MQVAEEGSAAIRSGAGAGRRVRAWDVPTRVFKWTLVVLVCTAWLSHYGGDPWLGFHIWNGYAILILVAFRLLWGLAGSSTARFSTWVTWPWTALRYGAGLLQGEGRPYLGHNPLGGWMIVALLAIVGSQGLAGLFTVDSNGLMGGPFSNLDFGDPTPIQRFLSRYHHWAFNLILAFASVHIAVNLFYQFVKRDPVVVAMIVGTKPVKPFADQPEMVPAPSSSLRAIICLAIATVLVLGLVRAFGGKLPF